MLLSIDEFESQLRTASAAHKLKSSLKTFLVKLNTGAMTGFKETLKLQNLYKKGYLNLIGVLAHPDLKEGIEAAFESTWYTDKWWVTVLSTLYGLRKPAARTVRKLKDRWDGGPTTF